MGFALQTTLFFTAIFVIISVPMSIVVGLRRVQTGITLLHGGDEELLRRMRAHGNFIEYVPLGLIALAGAEVAGAPVWLLILCGCALLLGRVLHYLAMRWSPDGMGRPAGALLTSVTLVALGVTILLRLASMI
ncbi:MAPEG family protein [Ruegeria jejuensis]|uniref:MAPEG family protein n=1 Tax=Ruegeria jejuensis TaxID=3233338 RepID=UPI00355BA8B1